MSIKLKSASIPLHDLVEGFCDIDEFRKIVSTNPAQVFETDSLDRTVFHKLGFHGHPEIVRVTRILLQLPEEESSSDIPFLLLDSSKLSLLKKQEKSNSSTALHPAVELGRTDYVKELLRLCPTLNTIENRTGNIPLHLTYSDDREVTACMTILLNVGPADIIYHKNSSLHTPLGALCFSRKTSQCKLQRMRMMLEVDHNHEKSLLKTVDKFERSPLHHCCNWIRPEDDRIDLPSETLKLFLKHCRHDPGTVNLRENNGSTALHVAAYSQSSNLVGLLLREPGVIFFCKNNNARSALHLAASLGCIDRCFDNVRMLTNPHLVKRVIGDDKEERFIDYLLRDMDDSGNTPLALACHSASSRSVHAILSAASAVQDPKLWFSDTKSDYADVLSLKKVYEYTPKALITLLDQGIRPDSKCIEESIAIFETDFSILTGLRDPLENGKVSEMENLNCATTWDFEVQDRILLHPLVQCFLFLLWEKLRPLKALLILHNSLWLVSYWGLITFVDSDHHRFIHTISAYSLIILCVLLVVNQTNKICALGFKHAMSVHTCTTLAQIILALVAVKPTFLNNAETPIETYCTAIGAILGFTLSMRNLGLLNLKVGLQVEYLVQMFRRIFFVLCCCSPLIVGFSLGFQKLTLLSYEENDIQTFGGTPSWLLIKTIVMMTGEYDYEAMFKNILIEKATARNETEQFGKHNKCNCTMELEKREMAASANERMLILDLMIFFVFLIVIPITFYNLLTGIAVEKVKDLHKKAKINLVLSQIHYIRYIQSSLLQISYILPCLDNILVKRFFATQQQPESLLSTRWNYCPVVYWKIRKCDSRFIPRQTFYSTYRPTVRGDGLPKRVKSRIFSIIYSEEWTFNYRFSELNEIKSLRE